MRLLFELGHQPRISVAELEATFITLKINYKVIKQIDKYLIIEVEKEIDSKNLINQLGGTVKISHKLEALSYKPSEKIINYLKQNQPTGKIEFSISGDNTKQLALEVKKELKSLGRSVRYIEPKNSATILYNKLVEKKSDLLIIDNEIYITQTIQPFAEMSERDYGRPGSDDKSGMLPPKLAKMLINLSKTEKNNIIFDPFCGSGTILTEALVMGYTNLFGSDISEKAIQDTEKNLEWIAQQYNNITMEQLGNIKLFVADATKLSNQIQLDSIDTIITEPYLGKPLHGNETENYIKKQVAELKNLYLNSLKEFYKILKSDGIVIFIIPRFKTNDKWIIIDCIEEIQKIGFIIKPFNNLIIQQSLLYHRPSQHLAREIWRIKKILT